MNHIIRINPALRRGHRSNKAAVGFRHPRAAGISGFAASVLAGASLLLGCPTHARATDIYTASYGGTNDTGGGAPVASGSFSLNTFTVTGIYGSGSSETLFVTDGTANARIYGTAPTGVAVGKEYTATVTASPYQGTQEFKSASANFTLQTGTATVTPQSATLAQVAATVTTSNTANPFTASPADSLYASESKLLFAPVTFTITPTTSGSLSTTSSTNLIDQSTGDTVTLYKAAAGLSYTAGKTYTVTGYEQPYNGSGTVESEIVGITGLALFTPPPTALYRQTTSGSWVPSGGTDWSSAAAGPGSTGWINDGTITAFFQKAPTGAITINGGNINATGLEFDTTGYNIASDGAAGDTLTLQNGGLVTVTNATDSATISAPIAGTVGLSKLGAGTLYLSSTTSTFTGGVSIFAGTVSISMDANLGPVANGVALSGGTLQTTSGFTTARGFTGTGSLDIAVATVLASTGTFNTSGVTLVNSGTLDLQGATPSVGNLAFSAPGTLESTTGQTASITGLTAPGLTSGVATVSTALTYAGATSLTTSVGAGGELDVTGAISTPGLVTKGGNVYLAKQGAGTLDLYGNNAGLYRVELGSATTGTPSSAGTLNINNVNSLGANQLFLNAGTLNSTVALTGANALPIGASLGALSNAPAVITGSNLEFAGASSIYESTTLANALTINNNTTFSGVLSSNTPQTVTSPGLLLTGTGTLTLSGANTFTDPIALSGGVTLAASGAGALGASVGVTVNTGGTLLLGGTASGRIGSVPITLGGGTFATGGNSDSAGALTLSASNSNIDFGTTGSKLTFANSSASTWAGTVFLLNYTDGSDALNFGPGGGLTAAQLTEVRYYGSGGLYAGTGFDAMGDVTFTPVPEPTTVLGGALLTLAAGWSQRRRLRAALAA